MMMCKDKHILCNAVSLAGVWIMMNLLMDVDRLADSADCKNCMDILYATCWKGPLSQL